MTRTCRQIALTKTIAIKHNIANALTVSIIAGSWSLWAKVLNAKGEKILIVY